MMTAIVPAGPENRRILRNLLAGSEDTWTARERALYTNRLALARPVRSGRSMRARARRDVAALCGLRGPSPQVAGLVRSYVGNGSA